LLDGLTRTSEASDPVGFIERNRALDDLDLLLFELTHDRGPDDVAGPETTESVARLVTLRDRRQRINDSMAQRLRERIAAASVPPSELLATFREYVSAAPRDARDDLTYDALDALVAGVLYADEVVAEGTVEWGPDMVPYQPTPARLILALLQDIRPTERDVFVDVGAGLGTVPTLVSLLTGARAIGIEWHPDYCACARRIVQGLNLATVAFVRQDASTADFSTGTIFYMFTPFKGAMLRDVLRRLDGEGRRRAIRLCVHGPLVREALREVSSFSLEKGHRGDDAISVFRSSPVA